MNSLKCNSCKRLFGNVIIEFYIVVTVIEIFKKVTFYQDSLYKKINTIIK